MDPLLALVVQPPPNTTTELVPRLEPVDQKKVVQGKWKMKDTFEDMRTDLGIVKEEFVLLNQILYKIHNRFHNDKGYKDLRMFEKSMNKFIKHDYLKNIEGFVRFLPEATFSHVSLPTRPMGFHSLLQVYGAAALLQRLHVLALNSGLLAVQRLNLGHFWGVGAHQLACIGRTWVVCRRLLSRLQIVYSALVLLLPILPGVQGNLESHLPPNLNKFLPEDLIESMNREETTTVVEKTSVCSVDSFLDIGVPIKRPEVKDVQVEPIKLPSSPREQPEKLKTTLKDCLSDIHSVEAFRQFLETETKTRKVAKKTCMTSKLKQDEWKLVKLEILKNLSEKTPNKSVKMCRKILRTSLGNHSA